MLSGGTTLETYGTEKAKQSLTALIDRIPNTVLLWRKGAIYCAQEQGRDKSRPYRK
jgi:cation transport ATPase